MRSRLSRLGLVLTLLLLACTGESRSTTTGTCSDASARYAATLGDSPLCDTQHVIAPLVPSGLGELSFSLQVLAREERSYCITDDDGEAHEVHLQDAQGDAVLDLVAGEPCRTLTLDQGIYRVTLRHGNPGAIDPSPDVFHTKLARDSGVPVFTFASNECEGCKFGDIGALPALSAERIGLGGRYAGAEITATCEAQGGHTDCQLYGDYSGATLDITSHGPTSILLGQQFADARLRLRYEEPAQLQPSRIKTVKGSNYSFASFTLSVNPAEAAASAYVIDAALCDGFDGFTGPITVNRIGYDALMRPTVDNQYCPTDLVMIGTDWHGSYFRSSPYVTHRFTPVPGQAMDFSQGTMVDFRVPANVTQPPAKFDEATLTRVTFADGADLRNVSFRKATLSDVSAVNAQLDYATFADSSINTLDLSGAVKAGTATLPLRVTGLDATNGDWKGLAASSVVFDNVNFGGSKLDDARFEQSTLAYGVFAGARLDRTSFRQAVLEAASFACAYGTSPVLSGINAEHVTFDNAHIYTPQLDAPATFSNGSAASAYFCGNDGDSNAPRGIDFPGTRLTNALFANTATTIWEPGAGLQVVCGPFVPLGGNAQTVCPNGSPGPCTGAAWIPTIAPPSTCSASDSGCAAQGAVVGASCTSPCGCLSRKCSKTGKCLR